MSKLTGLGKSAVGFLSVGFIALLLLEIVYTAFAWGFVLLKAYNWFILIAIPSFPSFTFYSFVGIATFMGCLFNMAPKTEVKSELVAGVAERVGSILLRPRFVLFLAWFIHVVIS